MSERDRIIQDLTNSLKQSIEIRDQLNQRNEQLAMEAKQFKVSSTNAAKERRKLYADEHEQRLSETTIDLVSESEFEDDELYKKRSSEDRIVLKPIESPTKISAAVIHKVKEKLTDSEMLLFDSIQEKVDSVLNNELNQLKEKLTQEQLEKGELESEANRLRQLLVNIKSGSADMVALRAELETIHKREMEILRTYFERKCTDLEKQ